MFDDLAAYFYENVVSSFESYRDVKASGVSGRSRDIKSAIVAATALYHLREHLPPAHQMSRAAAAAACPDYDLVADIVNAAKHKSLSRGTPAINDASQLDERTIITEYEDDEGTYSWYEKVVFVKLNDGSERDVLEVLTNVMNFWAQHLYAIGVLSQTVSFVNPQPIEPKSRADCLDNKLDMEIVKGLRFKQNFQLKEYDYAANQVKAVDMTGKRLDLHVIPLEMATLQLELKNGTTGEVFSEEITFNEEDSKTVTAITTEEGKREYLENHPLAKEAFKRLSKLAGRDDPME